MTAAVQAQVIRGSAVERGGGAPVPGVVMLLLDSADRIAARALTDNQGRYRLEPGASGTYRVRTLRIGYQPLISLPFSLGPQERLQQTLELASVAVALDTVRVVGRSACRALVDSVGAVATVWEQARTALSAAQLTAGTRTLRAATVRYQRTMDPPKRRTLSETSVADTNFVIRPWRSRSADSLRRFGYTHLDTDGWRTYHAPDLDVLLSVEFVEDHCFRLVASNDEPGLIGLAFEPTRERSRIPDIRGNLWLDRASSELRRMDFGYVNTGARGIDDAGGDIQFVRMNNGAWTISRWNIRMPALEERLGPSTGIPGAPRPVELRLRQWHVTGGELSLVTQGSDTLWERPRQVAIVPAPGSIVPTPGASVPTAPKPATTDTSVSLNPVEVSARRPMLTEFEERRLGSGGQFLTRADLAKQTARTLPDILSRLSGLRIARADGHAWVASSRTVTGVRQRRPMPKRTEADNQACYADVYLDGIMVYGDRPGEALFDINALSPEIIEGIEFYASIATTPVKYSRMGATCGTILIWTRLR